MVLKDNAFSVLHVGPVFEDRPSGPSFSILGLAKGMVENGARVALLPSEPPGIDKRAVPDNIALLPSPNKRQINPWKMSANWIRIIRNNFGDPCIVNFHDTYIPFHTALAGLCRKAGWPYVLTPRGGFTRLAQRIKSVKKTAGNALFINRFVRYANGIHALTENEAEDIRRLFPDSRVIVVPNGVDVDLFSLAVSFKNTSEKPDEQGHHSVKLGFVGRLDVYHKGLDLLLEAIKNIQNRHQKDSFHLLLVGPYYRKKDQVQIEKMVEDLPAPENITITGAVYGQRKWELLSSCDVFVHTSRFEGMPMAVLEAMAFGKPCMVTPGSNVQHIVSASRGGWLCEANIESITDTLLDIWIHRQKIRSTGKRAAAYAKRHLNWTSVANQWIGQMKEFLSLQP